MGKKFFLWTAVLLTSVMIFSFSSKSGSDSKKISEKITDKVVNISEEANNNDEIRAEITASESYKSVHKLIRKIAHIFEFSLLGAFTFLLANSYKLSLKNSILISLGYCLIFAVSDEIHQLFVDGRAGRAIDVLIDFVGSSIGVGFSWFKKGKITTK